MAERQCATAVSENVRRWQRAVMSWLFCTDALRDSGRMDMSESRIWTTVSTHRTSEGTVRYQRGPSGQWRILRRSAQVGETEEVIAERP